MWSLTFRPPRRDLQSALPLRTILPLSIFQKTSPYLLDESTKDYSFYPQWAINFNSATHILSVGRVKKCFFYVSLSATTRYPTKNAKVFAAYLPITLSTSWNYATSLALTQLNNPPSMFYTSPVVTNDDVLILSLPSFTQTLYMDGSFLQAQDSSPLLWPQLVLSPGSSVTINTNYAELIILWRCFVDALFSPKLLRQPNYLLWLSIRRLLLDFNLKIVLIKIPAHSDNALNVQVDSLAKAAHSSPQPSFSPLAFSNARNLLSFCSLARFTVLGPPTFFDWAGIHFCLSNMLPTLTTLQQRKPYLYSLDWLCSQCNSAPKDLNHLWTCHYILPDLNLCLTYRTEILTRGLLPAHLTPFLKNYFSLSVVYKTLSPLLKDFQVKLYGKIWLCKNILFHAWEESQGISASSKTQGLSTVFSSNISSHHHNSSLATVSQDS
ncbi:hypothetical protein RhiirA5_433277 [Rhizophagus irregularis]|uniref:RNase H type-1 domain-containing protein n=1 Tax=Rhizophagus irregularis TaxID=588596 RepID=A0A2N0NS04_9GLOM|nr:hypothetical protein RhiirA5_433277 [Rhizophagus irregularis]